jgi:hypothetical protein
VRQPARHRCDAGAHPAALPARHRPGGEAAHPRRPRQDRRCPRRQADPGVPQPRPDHATRGTAIFALGDIGSPESLEFLQNLERTEPHPTLKRLAREAQAKVKYQQAMRKTEAQQPLDTFLRPDGPPQQ